MATALAQYTQANETHVEDVERTEEFLHELAALSHKYGVGIAGSPTLFMLERDDYALAYACDDESNLILA